jgi:hypothetical protein
MVGVMRFLLQGVELLQIMFLGQSLRDANHTEMTTLPVVMVTLIFLEVHPVQQQEELMWMMAMAKGLKDLLLLPVTVRDVLVIMTPSLGQNVHMLHWLVYCPYGPAIVLYFSIILCLPMSYLINF